jgi:hypothetical protein
MISIRDADKQKLIDARNSTHTPHFRENFTTWKLIGEVLASIDELSQQAPVIEPAIAPMSEADKRICYPERYK